MRNQSRNAADNSSGIVQPRRGFADKGYFVIKKRRWFSGRRNVCLTMDEEFRLVWN
jgi:hypothetical protein